MITFPNNPIIDQVTTINGKVFKFDGVGWIPVIQEITRVVQSTGTSTVDVMSQKAVTDELENLYDKLTTLEGDTIHKSGINVNTGEKKILVAIKGIDELVEFDEIPTYSGVNGTVINEENKIGLDPNRFILDEGSLRLFLNENQINGITLSETDGYVDGKIFVGSCSLEMVSTSGSSYITFNTIDDSSRSLMFDINSAQGFNINTSDGAGAEHNFFMSNRSYSGVPLYTHSFTDIYNVTVDESGYNLTLNTSNNYLTNYGDSQFRVLRDGILSYNGWSTNGSFEFYINGSDQVDDSIVFKKGSVDVGFNSLYINRNYFEVSSDTKYKLNLNSSEFKVTSGDHYFEINSEGSAALSGGLLIGYSESTIPGILRLNLENTLEQYNGSNWVAISNRPQLSGSLTEGAPTSSEITAIIGYGPGDPGHTGAGFQTTIKNTEGTGLLYKVESDGVDWFYSVMSRAL